MCTVFSAVCVGMSAQTSNESIQKITATVTRSWAGAEQALQEFRMQAGVGCRAESVLMCFRSYSQLD